MRVNQQAATMRRSSWDSLSFSPRTELHVGAAGVSDVFNNQRIIEAEARELQVRSALSFYCCMKLLTFPSMCPHTAASRAVQQADDQVGGYGERLRQISQGEPAEPGRATLSSLSPSVCRLPLHAPSTSQEVGDFENWLKTMEWDMQTCATALDNVTARLQEKSGGEQQQPGGGAGASSSGQQVAGAGARR